MKTLPIFALCIAAVFAYLAHLTEIKNENLIVRLEHAEAALSECRSAYNVEAEDGYPAEVSSSACFGSESFCPYCHRPVMFCEVMSPEVYEHEDVSIPLDPLVHRLGDPYQVIPVSMRVTKVGREVSNMSYSFESKEPQRPFSF